jgi:hypothetical protein
VELGHEDEIRLLLKAIYGLKQAIWAWYTWINFVLQTHGFIHNEFNHKLSIHHGKHHFNHLCWRHSTHWDDTQNLLSLEEKLTNTFQMSCMGHTSLYIGIKFFFNQHASIYTNVGMQPNYWKDSTWCTITPNQHRWTKAFTFNKTCKQKKQIINSTRSLWVASFF